MQYSVLTITLNPAVDKSSKVSGIVPDKKLRCDAPHYEPGGGGVNVSRGLKRLGVDAVTFFVSGGRTGYLLEELLLKEHLNCLPFTVAGETRENFVVVDIASQQQYRFGFPGQGITAIEREKLIDWAANLKTVPDFVVISGSLPPGVPVTFLRSLIAVCRQSGSRVVVDTSGEALKAALEEGVFLVKPNIGELAALAGKPELDNYAADEAAAHLIASGAAEIIVLSLGAQGATLYTRSEKIQLPAPVVKKKSTVGAGDSMVAGLVYVLANGGSKKEMLCMGIACGSATTMAEGTGLFQRGDVDKLYREITAMATQ